MGLSVFQDLQDLKCICFKYTQTLTFLFVSLFFPIGGEERVGDVFFVVIWKTASGTFYLLLKALENSQQIEIGLQK